jgi:hypothetical protein
MHARIEAVSTLENHTAHIITGVLSVNQSGNNEKKAKTRLTAVDA